MALLDEIGKGISGIGRKTAQMGRDFSDTSRLNSLIAEEERNVQNCYKQIGKLYVDLHKNDCEDSFAVWVQNVLDSESKIAAYKKQVQAIKGVRTCPSCGADVQKASAFCSVCGTRMPVEVPPRPQAPADAVICANCGAAMPRGTKFCTACGSKLEQPAPAQTYAAPSVPPVPPVRPVPPAEPVQPEVPVQPEPVVPEPPAYPEPSAYDAEPAYSEPPVFDEPTVYEPAFAPAAQRPYYEEPAEEELIHEEVPVPELFQEQPAVQEPTNWMDEPAAPAVPLGRFCSNCGAKLEPDDIFCTECGTRYEA